MKYRAEIDGLRAIAIIPVIFFHAGFNLFDGGFIGVDIFFVISGYLITTLIKSELDTNSFSIVTFYERRARRILPALFLVCFTCIPFAWFLLPPFEFVDFSHSLIAVSTFSSNILFWTETGYFSPNAELKPLLHTWSLSVEEQFYIFFPLFLIILSRFKNQTLLIILTLLCLISLSLSEYAAIEHHTANFYLLPTRAWELGVGASLAIGMMGTTEAKPKTKQIVSMIGLAMVLYGLLVFDETVRVPSLPLLVPVIGTAMVIAYSDQNTVVGKLLSTRPLVFIGLISYSSYLWHQPLFAFTKIAMLQTPGIMINSALIAITFLLAYLTYHYIENPFRKKGFISRRTIFISALTSTIILIAVGYLGHINQGFKNRYSPDEINILNFEKYNVVNNEDDDCILLSNKDLSDLKEECFSSKNSSTILWGDSHAGALSLGFKRHFGSANYMIAAGCAPIINYRPYSRLKCKEINTFFLNQLIKNPPKLLVMHANWLMANEHSKQDVFALFQKALKEVRAALPETQIIVVGGVPQWYPTLPKQLVNGGHRLNNIEVYTDTHRYDEIGLIDQQLKQLSKNNNVHFFSVLEHFCKDKKCLSTVKVDGKNEPFTWDYGHLTVASASLIAREFAARYTDYVSPHKIDN